VGRCHTVNSGAVTSKNFLPLILQIGVLLCYLYSPAVHALVSKDEAGSVDWEAIKVEVAFELHQIVSINQREEHFEGVGTLHIRYIDPALAYERKAGAPPFRLYTVDSFLKLVQEKGTYWPSMVLDNQQGRRAVSIQIIALTPEGDIRYLERFTTKFQTPNFDFRRYPFDEQEFHINVTSVLPTGFYVIEEMSGISGVGDALGEEEWVVSDVSTRVSTVEDRDGLEHSRFSLAFQAERHLTYYIVRIFIPVFIILLVSWFTFLLQDYVKRVDMGITTLLLFIAYSFAVSGDLPRLGYLTAMDAFMTGTFTITGTVLLVNVMFRRLQTRGREKLVARLDRYAIIGYWPAYIGGMSVALLWL
jgi:hypothetical protein